MIAGVFPAKCPNAVCGEVGFWSTQPVTRVIRDRQKSKQPRVPFDVTHQDYKLFLKRIAVSKE